MNLPARFTTALIASAALVSAQNQQNPPLPPLPEKPVTPTDPIELPLVPFEIELYDRPQARRAMPREKAKQAADAMQPVLPQLDFGPQPSVFVKKFYFRGNSAFSDGRLAKEVAQYTGREITADELEAARVAVTKLYVDAGYINSGAVLPDQDPSDGTIELDVVEGRIAEVDLSGNRWYRSWWLRHVMRRAAGTPANFNKLRTGLQLMRQDGSLSRINAELKPGSKPGEGILHVVVVEEQPFRLGFEISNKRPISTGEGVGELYFADLNLTGHGDPFELRWDAFRWTTDGDVDDRGVDDISANYEFPVSPWGTTLRVVAGRSESSVIDETFAALGITSRTEELGITLRQPIIETLRDVVAISVSADRKHSETFLLGQPFTLSLGAIDGESDIFALRAALEWTNRSQVHVLSLRSTFSWGLDAFGATRAEDSLGGVSSFGATGVDVPDGKYFTWVGQAQYVRRIFDTPEWRKKPETPFVNSLRESLLVLRANAQLSDEPLLSLEQYTLGGVNSVRGYRENQLLRDNGIFGSIEWRWPVWLRPDKTPIVTVAPFFDIGTVWNTVSDEGDDANETIASAGLGLLLNVNKHFQASVYWGHPFTDLITQRQGLQDHGWHIAFTFNAF